MDNSIGSRNVGSYDIGGIANGCDLSVSVNTESGTQQGSHGTRTYRRHNTVGGSATFNYVVKKHIENQCCRQICDIINSLKSIIKSLKSFVGGGENSKLISTVKEKIYQAGIEFRININLGSYQFTEPGTDSNFSNRLCAWSIGRPSSF